MTATEIAPHCDQHRQQATEGEARDRARRIRDSIDSLAVLMRQAYESNDHLALGYERWADYIEGEFPESRLPARRELVALMAAQGMSERQIASATGIDKSAVHRHRAAASESEAASLRAADRQRKLQGRVEAEKRRVLAAGTLGITDERDIAGVTGVRLEVVRKTARAAGTTPAAVQETVGRGPARAQAAWRSDASAEHASSSVADTEVSPGTRSARRTFHSAGPAGTGPTMQSEASALLVPSGYIENAEHERVVRELHKKLQSTAAEVANLRRERDEARRELARLRQETGRLRAERDGALSKLGDKDGSREVLKNAAHKIDVLSDTVRFQDERIAALQADLERRNCAEAAAAGPD